MIGEEKTQLEATCRSTRSISMYPCLPSESHSRSWQHFVRRFRCAATIDRANRCARQADDGAAAAGNRAARHLDSQSALADRACRQRRWLRITCLRTTFRFHSSCPSRVGRAVALRIAAVRPASTAASATTRLARHSSGVHGTGRCRIAMPAARSRPLRPTWCRTGGRRRCRRFARRCRTSGGRARAGEVRVDRHRGRILLLHDGRARRVGHCPTSTVELGTSGYGRVDGRRRHTCSRGLRERVAADSIDVDDDNRSDPQLCRGHHVVRRCRTS